jgi:hypothetical protein
MGYMYYYVIYYNYRVIHISHLIVVVFILIFAKTEKTQWKIRKKMFHEYDRRIVSRKKMC